MDWPPEGVDASQVRARLETARDQDVPYASGRVLGSMCTEPHPLAVEAWNLFHDANLGDPDLCRGAAALERELRDWTNRFLHAPADGDTLVTSGGTEANLVALRSARDETGRRGVVAPETVHFSVDKACRALGLDLTRVAVDDGYRLDPDALAEAIDGDTAAVVAIAGNTEFGAIDPVRAAAEIAADAGAWCHVDAAYGGFIIPFLDDPAPFDLQVEGVTSTSVDVHKMGRGVIPCGLLTVRDASVFDRHATETPYVSTRKQATVVSTRSGAAVAAAWAALTAEGRDGLARTARRCVETAAWFADEFDALGVELPVRPETGVVPIPVDGDPVAARDRIGELGWRVSLVTIVPGVRVVCMPHVTRDNLALFLKTAVNAGVLP